VVADTEAAAHLSEGNVLTKQHERYLGVVVGPNVPRATMTKMIQRLFCLAEAMGQHKWMSLSARVVLARTFMWSTAVYAATAQPPTQAESNLASDALAVALWGRDEIGRPNYRVSRAMLHTAAAHGGIGLPSLADVAAAALQPILWKALGGDTPQIWTMLQHLLSGQAIAVSRPVQALRLSANAIDPWHPLLFALRRTLECGVQALYAPRNEPVRVRVQLLAQEPIRANPLISLGDDSGVLYARRGQQPADGRNITMVGHVVAPCGGVPSSQLLRAHGILEATEGRWRVNTAYARVPREWREHLRTAWGQAPGHETWLIPPDDRMVLVTRWYPN